jgi:hypothetical protein
MDSNQIRLVVLILVITVPLCLKRTGKKLENYLYIYLLFALLGEVVTIVYNGYNLLIYSCLTGLEVVVISLLVHHETSGSNIPKLVAVIFSIAFSAALYSDFCLINLINSTELTEETHIISFKQYIDLSTIASLGYLTLAFTWLIHLVQRNDLLPYENNKRYIFILAFIMFYGGTFFMLAFGRYLLPEFEDWDLLWSAIVHPILLLFYLIIFIGLLWKRTA